MIVPARSIWDTAIQCVCAIVLVRDGSQTDAWLCGNYGQASVDPPRLIINPNRLYPIEELIRNARRFSLNVMPASKRAEVLRFIRLRRRDPRKLERMGWRLEEAHSLLFLPDSLRTVFCDVEEMLETGDHTVTVGRVLESRVHQEHAGEPALLYRDIAGTQGPAWQAAVRSVMVRSGMLEAAKRVWYKRRPPAPADLRQNTYKAGGQTEAEVRQVISYGGFDLSRRLDAPPAPPPPARPVSVCVVGTHWGSFHCDLVRQADPHARLFVCGRDRDRAMRLAQAVHAEDCFIGLDAALRDQRVEALTLALPHHAHRAAAESALAAGKHVLVEKPIATTLEDANAMIAAAQASGRTLMVAEDMHFRPAVRMVQQRIDAGDIGEPLHLLIHAGGIRRPEGWAAEKDKMGGGVFMDIGVHYVRAVRLLLGEPDSVAAFRTMQVNTKITGEDGLQVVFGSRYGWTAHLLTSWSANFGMLPDVVAMGERGTFHLWPRAAHVDYYPADPRPLTQLISYMRPYSLQAKLMRPWMQRMRIPLRSADRTGYVGEVREFLASIAENRPPCTPAADARRDLEIVTAVYCAAETGRRTTIPPLAEAT